MIDPKALPRRALVDTTILLRALELVDDPNTRLCKAFFEAMLEAEREIAIAAPTLAEVIRRDGRPPPRTRGVTILSINQMVATEMGTRLPMSILRKTQKSVDLELTHIKFDSLIVGCSLWYKLPLVTLDSGQEKLAAAAGGRTHHPAEFLDKQLKIPFEQPTGSHLVLVSDGTKGT